MPTKEIRLGGEMSLTVLGVFRQAMQEGYAAGSKPGTIDSLPGSRHTKFETEESGYRWKVTDTWNVNSQSDASGGTTIVACDGEPILMLQYQGVYPPEAIPCLKEALAFQYAKVPGLFWHGGRGPEYYRAASDWSYSNRFERFDTRRGNYWRGEERVFDPKAIQRGWHTYQGQWMLPPG